jgi:hypothetical protein
MGVQVRWDKGGNESAIINEGEFFLTQENFVSNFDGMFW